MSGPKSSEASSSSFSVPCSLCTVLSATLAMSSPGLRAPTTQAWANPAQAWPSHQQSARALLTPVTSASIQGGTYASDVSPEDSRRQNELAGPGPGSQSLQQQRTQHHHQVIYDPYKWEKLLISGGIAGAISRTLTAPVDRLKMILQVQDDSKRGMTLREGVQRMRSEGSWTTFFKGNGANVLKIAPETAMKLTLNDVFKVWIARDHDHMTAIERMTAGGLAGAVAQFLTYPLDTIRTRLAVSRHGTYEGIIHAAMLMRRDEGMASFYRGLVPSMIGILPYAGVDIALFEIFKQDLLNRADAQGTPLPNLSLLVAGMLSSSIAQVVSYPLALIRTRLQAQGVAGAPLKYSGMMDVLQKTMEREGLRGLYKGLLPNIFKLAPAAGISWYVFEESKRSLGLDPRI